MSYFEQGETFVLRTGRDLRRAANPLNVQSQATDAVGPTWAHFSILDVVLTTASNPYIALPIDRQLTLGRATLSLTESLLNVTNKQDRIAIGQWTWDHPVECGKVSGTKVQQAQTWNLRLSQWSQSRASMDRCLAEAGQARSMH